MGRPSNATFELYFVPFIPSFSANFSCSNFKIWFYTYLWLRGSLVWECFDSVKFVKLGLKSLTQPTAPFRFFIGQSTTAKNTYPKRQMAKLLLLRKSLMFDVNILGSKECQKC